MLLPKQVDQNTDYVPEKRKIEIPSVTFIEEMRTAAATLESKRKIGSDGNKTQQQLGGKRLEMSSNRTPFGDVN